jgi:hypothetical protein
MGHDQVQINKKEFINFNNSECDILNTFHNKTNMLYWKHNCVINEII